MCAAHRHSPVVFSECRLGHGTLLREDMHVWTLGSAAGLDLLVLVYVPVVFVGF